MANGWTPRRLPDFPEFEGQPEECPIFQCAFLETTAAYQCTALENNQRLVKALKGDPRTVVKSMLIHPSNVQAVITAMLSIWASGVIGDRAGSAVNSGPQHWQDCNVRHEGEESSSVLKSSDSGDQHIGNPTLMEELIAKLPLNKRLD